MKRTIDVEKRKVYIGIDNGISGTIGIITSSITLFFPVPTFSQQNYTKKKGNITRIESGLLHNIFSDFKNDYVYCMLERPMVNPTRFQATTSALRALEATLIIIEQLGFSYSYCDSKEWQKVLLPKGSTKEQLKKDSVDIGCRLFPQHKNEIIKHKDADGILIAEYCRRKFR